MRLRGPLCLPAVGPPCLTRQQLSGAANTPLASPQRSGFLGSQHRHLFVGMQVGSAIRSHMQPLRAVVAAALGTRFVDPRLSAHRDLHASAKKKIAPEGHMHSNFDACQRRREEGECSALWRVLYTLSTLPAIV